jgi:hypothetical protein
LSYVLVQVDLRDVMADQFSIPTEVDSRGAAKKRFIVVLASVVAVTAAAFLLMRPSTPPIQTVTQPSTQTPQPAIGVEEQAYISSVGVDHLEISRAENFIHQEVTTVSGEVSNGGARALDSVELTLEFFDEQNQIAQREKRSLFGPPGPPISPGDNREFEISFEHISTAWNMRPPAVRVTGLQLSSGK